MRLLLAEVFTSLTVFSAPALAANGFEARLEVSRRRPQLVLLDEVLPGESGADLIQYLGELSIPILLVTGMQEKTAASRPLPKGVLGRIEKPSWETLDTDRERIVGGILECISYVGSQKELDPSRLKRPCILE